MTTDTTRSPPTTTALNALDRVLDEAIAAVRTLAGVVDTVAAAEKAIELLDDMEPLELAGEIYHALTINALVIQQLISRDRAPAKGSA